MYVTYKSRIIEGKFGNYQICNLKDCEGRSGTINLYKYNIDKLEISKIYKIERIKKTAIKSDHGPRLATTNFTKITDVTEAKAAVFAHVQLGDKRVKGQCILFSDLLSYKACTKHNTKLDTSGECGRCGQSNKGKLERYSLYCKIQKTPEIDIR